MNRLSSWLEDLQHRLGSGHAKPMTWMLALLCCAWAVLDVLVVHVSNGLSQATYDAMVRHRLFAAAPDPRVLILDIDEASLARMAGEFGRWPWPRDTLATVLDFLEREQVEAVVWDVAFADPDKFNPGGDAAFNAAATRSKHSHFSVIRLPVSNDSKSQLTARQLPGLWLVAPPAHASAATVALIPPVLPALAQHHLGYNNGYPDTDGMVRRYRYAERLGDGSVIQSVAVSVAQSSPGSRGVDFAALANELSGNNMLMAWRGKANAYSRVRFADVFDVAEGGKSAVRLPDFKGKVVVIGSSAPSLHDVHSTPLSSMQAGVETLATAIDNALHQRWIRELPQFVQAGLSVLLILGLAAWVQLRGPASLEPLLLALPALLLAISYVSLHTDWLFIDLHQAASLALIFLAALRVWNSMRHAHWSQMPDNQQTCGVQSWQLQQEPTTAIDDVLAVLEKQGPDLRILTVESRPTWPQNWVWPEMIASIAVIGPESCLARLMPALEAAVAPHQIAKGEWLTLQPGFDRKEVAEAVLRSRLAALRVA